MNNSNPVAFCILVFFEPQARIWYDRLVTADYALPRFCFFPSYNWVLYSPRGSASQCNRQSDQPNLYIGNVGTTDRWTFQREDRLLPTASRRERSLWLRGEEYQTEWHAFRVGRAQKVDRVSDLGTGWDQSRWRTPELSYLGQNSRGRYVSQTLTENLSVYLRHARSNV